MIIMADVTGVSITFSPGAEQFLNQDGHINVDVHHDGIVITNTAVPRAGNGIPEDELDLDQRTRGSQLTFFSYRTLIIASLVTAVATALSFGQPWSRPFTSTRLT